MQYKDVLEILEACKTNVYGLNKLYLAGLYHLPMGLIADKYVHMLRFLVSGSLEISLAGKRLAMIDASEKEAVVDVGILEFANANKLKFLARNATEALRLPAKLSNLGWKVFLVVNEKKLIELGRGTNPFTGYAKINILELLRLRKLRS